MATAGPHTRIRLYAVQDGTKLAEFEGDISADEVVSIAFANAGKHLIAGTKGGLLILNADSLARVKEVADPELIPSSLEVSHDGRRILAAGGLTAVVINADDWSEAIRIKPGIGTILCGALNPDGSLVMLGSNRGLSLHSVGGQHISTLLPCDGGLIATTSDGYYSAPRDALPGIAYRMDTRAIPADYYDAVFNRPDIVLDTVAHAPPHIVALASRIVERRRTKLGLTTMPAVLQAPPLVGVSWSNTSLSTLERTVTADISAESSSSPVASITVRVNGVPIKVPALDSVTLPTRAVRIRCEILLTPGMNRIHITAVDTSGVVSIPVIRSIQCTAADEASDLYVLAIGVSHYAEKGHDLSYAHKDARDLADLLAKNWKRGDTHIKLLIDQDATAKSITEAGVFLEPARPDDTVILFLAGHGLLDREQRFYFGTYDIAFGNPEAKGLPYDAIEMILRGTAARQKLLLVDACHAGTLVAESLRGSSEALGPVQGVTRGAVAPTNYEKPPSDLAPFLRDLLVDIGSASGAITIAASAGEEYAYEDKGNGVFTYSIIEGLKYRNADSNEDGLVSVHELRAYICDRVRYLTGGRQSPSPRNYSPEFDFVLF